MVVNLINANEHKIRLNIGIVRLLRALELSNPIY